MELYMVEEFEIARSFCPYWLVVGSANPKAKLNDWNLDAENGVKY